MKLVLLGKPLSGKGTQAALLSKALDISVLSLGALFRREVEKKSVLGKKVEKYMKKGTLVPHSVTFPFLQKYLPKKCVLLILLLMCIVPIGSYKRELWPEEAVQSVGKSMV